MAELELRQTPPLAEDAEGAIRVQGSRVTLDIVVGAFLKGATAKQLQDSFPSLSWRDIYGTIAFYLEHQPAVTAYLARRRTEAALREMIESQPDTAAFRARLHARCDSLVQI
jgi:uncharacterized protein (DUF433 family)